MSDEQHTMPQVSKHFSKTYIGIDKDGKEVLGAFLKDGREVRVYVSATGRKVRFYLDGNEGTFTGKKASDE